MSLRSSGLQRRLNALKPKKRTRGPPFATSLGARAELRLHPGWKNYFLAFFAFLTFFAFFAFFAFLAIASSFGLMGGNATRGMLGGGPTSQHPRSQSQQIRGLLPRAVTLASSRYPQLLCVLDAFSAPRCASRRRNFASASRRRAARNGLSGLIPRQRSQSIARR